MKSTVNPINIENAGTMIPGQTKRILRKVMMKAVLASTQLELISKLRTLHLGFADLEEFIGTTLGKFKSKMSQFKFESERSKQIDSIMDSKIVDAKEKLREAQKERKDIRSDFDKNWNIKTRKCKNVLKKLNHEIRVLRSKQRKKNSEKIDWLLTKYRKDRGIVFSVPEDIQSFKNVNVFDPAFKVPDAVTKFEPKVVIIGPVSYTHLTLPTILLV